MDATQPTRLRSLVLQGTGVVAAGVISAAAVGSFIQAGPSITDSSLFVAPSQLYDSGSYLTYRECETGKTRSGCTTANSGGLATSNTCVITNPFDGTTLPFNGSGALWRAELDVLANPTAAKWDIGPVKATTSSGSAIADSVSAATGSRVVRFLSGSTNGNYDASYLYPAGFLKFTATTATTASTRVKCKVWMNQVDR